MTEFSPFNCTSKRRCHSILTERTKPMYPIALTFVLAMFASGFLHAEDIVPKDHATVHIVFIVPYEIPNQGGMGGMVSGDNPAKTVPRAIVGDMVLPIPSIHPISISIDGEFVGHAMTGSNTIKPIFVLPHGKHQFEFSSDVHKKTKVAMTVIGSGSKQYLIVKLPPASEESNGSNPDEPPSQKSVPKKG